MSGLAPDLQAALANVPTSKQAVQKAVDREMIARMDSKQFLALVNWLRDDMPEFSFTAKPDGLHALVLSQAQSHAVKVTLRQGVISAYRSPAEEFSFGLNLKRLAELFVQRSAKVELRCAPRSNKMMMRYEDDAKHEFCHSEVSLYDYEGWKDQMPQVDVVLSARFSVSEWTMALNVCKKSALDVVIFQVEVSPQKRTVLRMRSSDEQASASGVSHTFMWVENKAAKMELDNDSDDDDNYVPNGGDDKKRKFASSSATRKRGGAQKEAQESFQMFNVKVDRERMSQPEIYDFRFSLPVVLHLVDIGRLTKEFELQLCTSRVNGSDTTGIELLRINFDISALGTVNSTLVSRIRGDS